MAGRLVTIARFDLAGQAHIARNALDAAGIKAVITDEAIVAMDWLLSNAVGGIKVQVLEEDADRALAVLEQALGSDEPDEPVDEEALAAEAEAAGAEEQDELPTPKTLLAPELPAPPVASPTSIERPPRSREDYARSLLFIAWIGLAFPPVWFVALYFFFNAAFGSGPLSPRGRYNLLVGSLVVCPGAVLAWMLCAGFSGAFG
ncbi:Uncharacterized protein OS=Vibrio orientalis CIP 102891 = ATCC 33934 GN=VIA_002736 PE=4 SV=1: DUF2007 [Gemmata massiliana]|uniref:DUF2007 domain-containing protein n=1 Tax=Gemmata massiliana TaxID=1210884 RepID=A0A6P2DQR8_9BACT|nr:DUF2007 domain-containing protein [Gemmata massiliana]VTS03873.1 Uncharacterized protein OS=Vibrio orientalis CIP 102891 = ATCC 33934 GN=VIA_002736 PE=4 SV=1: DUF2007 [Gemmata massiliana]